MYLSVVLFTTFFTTFRNFLRRTYICALLAVKCACTALDAYWGFLAGRYIAYAV